MSASASGRPHVLLLSLDVNSSFDQLYQRILGKLNTAAILDRATKPESALQGLEDQSPHAVLVTDGSITHYRGVYAGLLDYVRGGGTLVLMGNFSSTIRPKDLDKFFHDAGLPWTHADYMRTMVYRNDTTEGVSSYASLPSSYSQKAVFLANVPVHDAWYLPTDSSRTESLVFPSEWIQNLQQTPIALTSIGNGRLGYVGDVNGHTCQ
ncbi:hypothetical protein EJ02DRAFT_481654 [Clathrospora elynae]|uniref:Uncharacterized protein n=1 Tax=Clathrospora elynae TaxID=706981 RepID=A0A6A5S8Q9_9PLEO|nr:hypothetical protein EJ02DRAFT_481654 [Clathrospora elynae]